MPVNFVPADQQMINNYGIDWTSLSDPLPYPVPPNALIQAPTDRHMIIVQAGTCKLYEFWHAYQDHATNEVTWDMNSNSYHNPARPPIPPPNGLTSADAAGLPILPGLLTYDEVEDAIQHGGVVRHAIRTTIQVGKLKGDGWTWPAYHTDGTGPSDAIPMGARLRLKASYQIPTSFSPQAKVILQTMKEYGMIVADTDGDNLLAVDGMSDRRWGNPWDVFQQYFNQVSASNFEFVDESGIMVSNDSMEARMPNSPSGTPAPTTPPTSTTPTRVPTPTSGGPTPTTISGRLINPCPVNQRVVLAVPGNNAIYHGGFNFGGQEDVVTDANINSFENLAGKRMAWAYFSNNWTNGNISFPTQAVNIIANHGALPFIRMEPRSQPTDPHAPDPIFTMQKFINGDFDAALHQYARDAKNTNVPLMIQFGHEVNLDSVSYNATYNGGNNKTGYGDPNLYDGPERYRDAYRHVIDIFRQEGVNNVTWAFHVNMGDWPEAAWNRMQDYYPGDSYIDWVGMSAYGQRDQYVTLRTLIETWGSWTQFSAISSTKPQAIFELAAPESSFKAQWITNAFSDINAHYWPRMKGEAWWSEDYDNLRFDSTQASLNAYRAAVASPVLVDRPQFTCNGAPAPTTTVTQPPTPSVPSVTNTPRPTATRTPTPTFTPYPSQPTSTPRPTNTPGPTSTPRPTPTDYFPPPTYTPFPLPTSGQGMFHAYYWSNRYLSGSPARQVDENITNSISHDWGYGSPISGRNDNFSARWTGVINVSTAGTYRFGVSQDDGVRIWIDGVLIFDRWSDQSAWTTRYVNKYLSQGGHEIQVDYYEHTGRASVNVSWNRQ
jgi:hypothetical protein